jgi:hypothetical protein
MAVPEAEFSLFDKDDQENWLEVDLDASFSDAESSKDSTPTAMVLLLNCTELSF